MSPFLDTLVTAMQKETNNRLTIRGEFSVANKRADSC